MSDAHAERVKAINAAGKVIRDAMDDARRRLDDHVEQARKRLKRKFPGAELDKDLASLLEQTGQRLRHSIDEVERKRREGVRAATLANEDGRCTIIASSFAGKVTARVRCGAVDCPSLHCGCK